MIHLFGLPKVPVSLTGSGRASFRMLLAAILAAITAPPAAGQLAESTPGMNGIPRVTGAAIHLDGRLEEEVWATLPPVWLDHQLRPNEGSAPSERTEVRLFYDGEALYLGARLHERDPAQIQTRTGDRNSFHRIDQDGFAIVLDTNRDRRTAFGFIVTPNGARTDIAVFDEARVSWNSDWNAFWDAATHQDENGWSVEIRIPFSSLRFEADREGRVEMAVILWRYLARNDEFAVYPAFPNDWGNSAYKPALGQPVVLEGLAPVNPVYLKPYFLVGGRQLPRLHERGDRYVAARDFTREFGADLKYNVTNNVVLDLTVNTDFAQVEADDQRFNLERFSLFFPEKRDFFQERSDLFNFRLPGGSDRLFHSRRIGIERGVPVPLRGGARLTGQLRGWELGLLNMQTGQGEVDQRVLPSENFGVIRVQRPVLDEGSYLGGLLTSRTDLEGTVNMVYALDGDLHLGGGHFLGLQAAGSSDRGPESLVGGMASLVVQRRINRGLSFGHSFGHISTDFRPAVGFVRRTGTNRWGHRTQYTWFPATENRLQNHSLAHRWEFVWDDRFEQLETYGTSLNWDFRFRSGAAIQSRAEYTRDELVRGFQVGGLRIPADKYHFLDGSLGFSTPSSADLQLSVTVNGGGYYGGHRTGASSSLSWTPGAFLGIRVESVINRIDLPSGVEDVFIHRVRVGSALSRTLTLDSFIQHNSASSVVTPNIRLRWNPREGSDLFLVYNEALNMEVTPADFRDPVLPRSQYRSFQVKYTYTFVGGTRGRGEW